MFDVLVFAKRLTLCLILAATALVIAVSQPAVGRAQTEAAITTSSMTLQAKTATLTATQRTMMTVFTSPRSSNQRYVFLQARASSAKPWKKLGTMGWSDSAHRYYLAVRPSASTYYRAMWYNNAGQVRAVSPAVRIQVRPRLRLYSSSYTFAWGRRVRFYGSAWPNHYRQRVNIQILAAGRWVMLYRPRLDKSGRYSAGLFKPRLKGTYKVRAILYKPDWDHLSNSNGPKTLDVVQSTGSPEGRAVWVTRWDFRASRTYGPIDIRRIMRNAWQANLNTVYFQVRGQADAYYRSRYEPWAARLTGHLGRNPGWDPLQVAIDAAHSYGLKLSAWMNVYTMWSGTSAPPTSTPMHIYYNPGWRVATRVKYNGHWYYRNQRLNRGYLWASPGNPAVRQHVERVAVDIVSNYDVDGIHLDKVRYPGPSYSWDEQSRIGYAAANAAYKATHKGATLSRSIWQRRQVSALVHTVYDGVKGINPALQVSAACSGMYTNRWKWTGVTDGLAYYYEDSQAWTAGGFVDYLAPMTFWDMDHVPRWGTLVQDFVDHRNGRGIYAGIAAYMYRSNWNELRRQIAGSRSLGAQGVSFFDYHGLGGKWVKLSDEFPEMVEVPSRGAKTDLSIESTTTTPSVGETIAVLGTLLPDHRGQTVSVRLFAGTHWDLVGTSVLDADSRYRVWFTPAALGTYRLRAVFKGDADHAGSTSRDLVITAN